MWKGPTIPMDDLYPFGVLPTGEPKHLVRKKIDNSDKQLKKAQTQAALKHDCLIKMQSAQEEDGNYYLLFEYVATPLEKWYTEVSREFI